jgi:predicted transcriptional regulator
MEKVSYNEVYSAMKAYENMKNSNNVYAFISLFQIYYNQLVSNHSDLISNQTEIELEFSEESFDMLYKKFREAKLEFQTLQSIESV